MRRNLDGWRTANAGQEFAATRLASRRRSRKCSMLKLDGQKLEDGRLFTGTVERNKDPILNLLKRVLPDTGLILEIGSGTGQHVAHFAKALPQLTWQPSDPDDEFRESIRSWTRLENLDNVRAPIDLEVCR